MLEAILLLVHLSDGHQDVQKIIAFENAFDRIFNIIDVEGGVDGGIIVQDCLQLLTNLLAYNASKQVLFRETGFVPRLYKLFNVEAEIQPYAMGKRNNNLHMALGVCRACIAPGGQGTPANQVIITPCLIDQQAPAYNFTARLLPQRNSGTSSGLGFLQY